jgi:peroxiredoxin
LREYQKHLSEMQGLGASLIAITPESPDKSLSTAEKNALQFEVLTDAGHKVARQFGLAFAVADVLRPIYKNIGADLPAYNGDESWELPIPATYVVAKDGTVRLAFVDADYTHRLEPTAIIDCLREIGQQ